MERVRFHANLKIIKKVFFLVLIFLAVTSGLMFGASYLIYKSANNIINSLGLGENSFNEGKTCNSAYNKQLLSEFDLIDSGTTKTFNILVKISSPSFISKEKISCNLIYIDNQKKSSSKNAFKKTLQDNQCLYENLNLSFNYRIDIVVGEVIYESLDIYEPIEGKTYLKNINIIYDPSLEKDSYRCIDSDPEDNIFQKGYIMVAGRKFHDDCDDNCLNVLEKSCPQIIENNKTSSGVKFYQCPNGCENGACLD